MGHHVCGSLSKSMLMKSKRRNYVQKHRREGGHEEHEDGQSSGATPAKGLSLWALHSVGQSYWVKSYKPSLLPIMGFKHLGLGDLINLSVYGCTGSPRQLELSFYLSIYDGVL